MTAVEAVTRPALADLGFRSAATFYYAARLICQHRNRETADDVLAKWGGRLTADQWAYVERHVGLPPTGQLAMWEEP